MKPVIVYQLIDRQPAFIDATFMSRFMNWEHNESRFDFSQYGAVWNGERPDEYSLTDAWEEFNCYHPAGYQGRSMAVSDLVMIQDKYWFCDSIGWVDVTELCSVKAK